MTNTMNASAVTHYINNETVHNWRNRYDNLPYFADLSATARKAMNDAHSRHYAGTDCKQEALDLAARFPTEFYYSR